MKWLGNSLRSSLSWLANTDPGRKLIMFVVPFWARPSEFAEHEAHPLYGRVTGFGPPLLTAWLFQKAFSFEAATQVKHFDWQAKTVGEAIASSQNFVNMASWTALFLSCTVVLMISATRWIWHFFLRKATNRYRRDGSIAGRAIQFCRSGLGVSGGGVT